MILELKPDMSYHSYGGYILSVQTWLPDYNITFGNLQASVFYKPSRGVLFEEVAECWLKMVASQRNKSWKMQKRQLEMHVYPAWEGKSIGELKRSDVYRLLDALEGSALPNRILALIRTILNFAVSREWITGSPAAGIPMPRRETVRQRVLTMSEVAQVVQASLRVGYPFGAYILVLLLTAQRRTEVASMRWSEVDHASRNWVIPAAKTKSNVSHVVPLSSLTMRILSQSKRKGEFVFTNDGRTHISGYAKGKRMLDEAIARSGPSVESWRFHDLRRSAATHMVRLGAFETVVGRILNHAQRGLTTRVYALHSHAERKREALENWAAEVKSCFASTAKIELENPQL